MNHPPSSVNPGMTTAHVVLRLPGGETVAVPPGGILGRLAHAAVHIDHPLVSEAHALVSLRGRELKLLALRGAMEVNGERPHEVTLARGQQIRLAPGVELQVEAVVLPEGVLAVRGLGPAPVELPAPTASVLLEATRQLLPGFVQGAAGHFWSTGDAWSFQARGGAVQPVTVGARWTLGDARIEIVSIPLERAAVPSTRHRGQLHPQMTLTVFFDQTHIAIAGRTQVTLSGQGARLIAELVLFDNQPTPWHLVAGEIWSGALDRKTLRWNYDKALRQLRQQLESEGLRTDLVQSRLGIIQLHLLPRDRFENRV